MIEKAINKLLTKKQIEVQIQIKNNNPRHVILEGAVRSGKTYLAILYWLSIVCQYKKKLFIMTGHTISSLKRNVLDEISNMIGVNTHLNINNEFELYGNKIACFGSDKADSFKSMRGLTAQGWYANEVILSHHNSVMEAFSRCSEYNAKIIWETNPDKPTHWVKTDYMDRSGQKMTDGSYDILSFHFELTDNTRLDNKYIESLQNSIPKGTIYDRLILGKWQATDKAIYTNWTVKNVFPQENYYNDTSYGLDFGYNHPTALIRVDYKEDEAYITECFCKSHMLIGDIIDELKKHVINKALPIYCDTADPEKIQEIKEAGFNAIEADKSVKAGLNKVKTFKLFVRQDDTDLQRELENYEYRKTSSGEVTEEPVKINDDRMDAMRYAIHTHQKTNITLNDIYGVFNSDDDV